MMIVNAWDGMSFMGSCPAIPYTCTLDTQLLVYCSMWAFTAATGSYWQLHTMHLARLLSGVNSLHCRFCTPQHPLK